VRTHTNLQTSQRRFLHSAENNETQPHGTIDLHGLYVKEAIEQVDKAIAGGQRSGLQELRVITGKGIHSQNHQAKIKPAVAELMQK
jgi:DNA-nicking Smr family endonuclease